MLHVGDEERREEEGLHARVMAWKVGRWGRSGRWGQVKFPRGCCVGTQGDRAHSLKEGGLHKDPADFSLLVTAEEQDWSKLAVWTA